MVIIRVQELLGLELRLILSSQITLMLKNQLMFLSNTIPTLEDAKAERALEKAERALEKAERAATLEKAERAAERQFLLQQGDSILFHSFTSFSHSLKFIYFLFL
jgi:hypothetical protein